MKYEDYTLNSKNPLARFAHRSRAKVAYSLIEPQPNLNLLDFGCGDGDFLLRLSEEQFSSNLVGFEPYMEQKKLSPMVDIYKSWDEIKIHCDEHGLFDTVTCFEVFEHFSIERQIEAINKIRKVLKPDGNFIISVPIEKGLPIIPKNLRRIAIDYKGNKNIYTLSNIICSLFGIKSESLNHLRKGDDYLTHMGFYFTDLEDLLKENFVFSNILHSPFSKLPYYLNSQVFYQLKPK
jgi:SAM-dependent methyltransferase